MSGALNMIRHRFHSICPYFAMFPESLPDYWIKRLTKPGDVVLDPFSGRGTTAFSALLLGRRALACDVNDVAFCLSKAKTQAPAYKIVRSRVENLREGFDGRHWQAKAAACPEFFRVAYAPRTLQQLLYLRQVLRWRTIRSDAMIAAIALGSLHGEADKSQSYFSNQMPRTISTKPAYSIRFWKARGLLPPERDVFDVLSKRTAFRYESDPPEGRAVVLHDDVRRLPWRIDKLPQPIKCVITSPPYFDVTSFEEDQWLRLWFLGGPPYPTRGRVSRDDRYGFEDNYWRFIADMWRSLGAILSRGANVIIRIGSRRLSPESLVNGLRASSQFAGRRVRFVDCETSDIKNRQTHAFLPGTIGCACEVDCHFAIRN